MPYIANVALMPPTREMPARALSYELVIGKSQWQCTGVKSLSKDSVRWIQQITSTCSASVNGENNKTIGLHKKEYVEAICMKYI